MLDTRKTGYWVVLLCFMFCCSLRANTVSIDLSSIANGSFNSSEVANGNQFPTGHNVFNGIQFNIATGANNAWFGSLTNTPVGTETVDVHPGTFGATTAYTLLNTMFIGAPGSLLKFTFIGSAGAIYTYFMTSGVDYRDYNQSVINTISGNTSNAWNNMLPGSTSWQRLDMQTIQLPSVFRTQFLTDVILTDDGAIGVQRSIWAGLTIGQAGFDSALDNPEPGTVVLFASGLALCFVWGRKRLRT
jgi:hypothetical protein